MKINGRDVELNQVRVGVAEHDRSKISNKFEIFRSVSLLTVGARETWLPVGNQISQPVTKSLI
jgi:hypothetical protein